MPSPGQGASPSPSPARPRAVVVGLDGSDPAAYALEVAQDLAASLGAELVLAHAYDPRLPILSEPTTALRNELRRHGEKVLHDARATIAAPLDVVRDELVEGRTYEALAEVCERHAPALLVVGTRGLGGVKELLLGSTSRWAVDHAPCPVLVARRPPSAA